MFLRNPMKWRERLAQRDFERPPLLHALVHGRLKEPIGAASVGLGAVERHVVGHESHAGFDGPFVARHRQAEDRDLAQPHFKAGNPAEGITATHRGRDLSRAPAAGHHNIGFRCAR